VTEPKGPSSSQIFDEFIAGQAMNMDACYQQMQDIDEFLQTLGASSSPEVQKPNAALYALLSDIEIFGLALTELLIGGAELSALSAIGVTMAIPAAMAGGAYLGVSVMFGETEKDKENSGLAMGIMANPATLLSSTISMVGNRGDLDSRLHEGIEFGKGLDSVMSLASSTTTLSPFFGKTASSAEKTLSAVKGIAASAELVAKPFHPFGSPNMELSPLVRPIVMSSPPTLPAPESSFARDIKSVESAIRSNQREAFGTPAHYLWGDPQENQLNYSNGRPSRGSNSYGNLLPTYLGGTGSSEGESDENGYQDDNDNSSTTSPYPQPSGLSFPAPDVPNLPPA
jgi:hypothetical protein